MESGTNQSPLLPGECVCNDGIDFSKLEVTACGPVALRLRFGVWVDFGDRVVLVDLSPSPGPICVLNLLSFLSSSRFRENAVPWNRSPFLRNSPNSFNSLELGHMVVCWFVSDGACCVLVFFRCGNQTGAV